VIGAQIVGFKGSGKSTLVAKLAAKLKADGRRIAVVKNACHPIVLGEKEERALAHADEVFVLSKDLSLSVSRNPLQLLQALARLESDVVLAEGFKDMKIMPRILLCKTAEERITLGEGLALDAFGPGETDDDARVTLAARRILQKGFVLPGVNCHKCGFPECAGLAAAIVAGQRKPADCTVFAESTRVTINGTEIALSPFVAEILKSTCGGFLRSLKGVTRGKVRLEMDL
jgi:molybdopterin-guanine dinucleotide biosynthesis protein B